MPADTIDLAAADAALLLSLKPRAYRLTFESARLTADGDTLTIELPSRFLCQYVTQRHAAAIESARAAAGATRAQVITATSPAADAQALLWDEGAASRDRHGAGPGERAHSAPSRSRSTPRLRAILMAQDLVNGCATDQTRGRGDTIDGSVETEVEQPCTASIDAATIEA